MSKRELLLPYLKPGKQLNAGPYDCVRLILTNGLEAVTRGNNSIALESY